MATILENGKNVTIECKYCGAVSIYHINENGVSVSDHTKDGSGGMCALPLGIYNNHIEEIREKFKFYQDLGFKGKVSKRDVCLYVDEEIREYEVVCPKCGSRTSKTELLGRKSYIKIYPPDSPGFEYAEFQWISLDNDEVEKYLK